MKVSLREILLTLFIILLIFVTLRVTVHSYKVYGQSMDPSFHNGQYLLVNKASYHLHSPRRGDVIVFQYPLNPSELYIKRIIGLPGERVEIRNNQVYIDDELLEEPEYIPSTPNRGSPITVPPDEYFVLGDNRNHSADSRAGWTVPRDNIIGKTWLSYWPPGDWGMSPTYAWSLA
jgi:signal peptidase I